ncbi:hypothetical protein QUR06_000264 [Escherichia coli]|nr:hypothetical protein [Escherichia coli]
MSNFFGEIFKRAGDLVSHPVKIGKDLVTKPKKGWHELTHLYTYNEHKDQDLLQKGFGIHGWVGKHPQESALAVVGTIFGGWAAWGAYGASAAAGATGAASGSALGGAGSAMAYTPTASAVLGGAGSAGSGSALAYGGSMAGNAIAATGSTWGVGASGSVGLSGAATTGGISGAGAGWSSLSFAAPEGSAMAYAPTQSTVLGGSGSGVSSSGWSDWATNFNRANNLMKQNNQQGQQAQPEMMKPQSVDLLHKLMQSQNGIKQGAESGQMFPQSTNDIIGANKPTTGTDFKNQF